MVNVQYDWPMTNYTLSKVMQKEFADPYGTIHHYETYEYGPYPAGLHVDEVFYNTNHKLNVNGQIVTKNGNELCKPVTIIEHYTAENDKKREIYLLKRRYLQAFVDDFRNKNLYKKSGNYISQQLKKTG